MGSLEIERLLLSYVGPESERVRSAISLLAGNDLLKVQHYLAAARQDYRDVVWWAQQHSAGPAMRSQQPTVSFNGVKEDIRSVEALGSALDRFDIHPRFELWVSMNGASSLCMLRNEEYAFLMYLRFPGDSGFVSSSDTSDQGVIEYQLSNGQLDTYPALWCIPKEQCYKAIAYFFVNEGQRPEWVAWHES